MNKERILLKGETCLPDVIDIFALVSKQARLAVAVAGERLDALHMDCGTLDQMCTLLWSTNYLVWNQIHLELNKIQRDVGNRCEVCLLELNTYFVWSASLPWSSFIFGIGNDTVEGFDCMYGDEIGLYGCLIPMLGKRLLCFKGC